jgi:hypothetical protein
MTRPLLLLLRAAAVGALLLWLAQRHATDIVGALMPGLRWALERLAGDFRILSLDFHDDRGNRALAALAMLEHVLLVDGRVVVPDGVGRIRVTTTLGNVLQPVLVGLALIGIWPGRWREWLWRPMLLAPLLAVVLVLDTPLGFALRLWHTTLNAHQVPHDALLLGWVAALNGGGRLALGLVAGGLAVAGAATLASHESGRGTGRSGSWPAGAVRVGARRRTGGPAAGA